jgi:hypothetical protein
MLVSPYTFTLAAINFEQWVGILILIDAMPRHFPIDL